MNPPLKPTLENPNYGPDWFLTECSLKKYKSGNYNHGFQMLGYAKDEIVTFTKSEYYCYSSYLHYFYIIILNFAAMEGILGCVKYPLKYAFQLGITKFDMPNVEYGITNATLRKIIKVS